RSRTPRGETYDSSAVNREFLPHDVAHIDHCCFRCRIGKPSGSTIDSGGGGDIDDQVERVPEVKQLLHEGERAIEVDAHRAFKILKVHLVNGDRVGITGIVDQGVDISGSFVRLTRSEEHTYELQSRFDLVGRLL